MALTDEEQKLYDAFLKLDLLDPDYGYPFIDYCENVLGRNYESRKPVLELCDKVKNRYMKLVNDGLKNPTDDIIKTVQDADPIFWGILKMEARNRQFDSYCIYLEKEREPKERFYMPRRACLRRLGIPQAFQRLIDDELDLLTISLPPGTGKASMNTSKVLTPTGFKLMGDIKVGDRVIAGNGNVSTVIGVYPQGKRPCYRFTLDDGSHCEVSDNHLWSVRTRDDRVRHKGNRIVKTVDMLKNYRVENDKRCNYSIDYVPRIEFASRELDLHPYILGNLIGNGGLRGAVTIATEDVDVIDRLNELLPNGYYFENSDRCTYRLKGYVRGGRNGKNVVRQALTKYGLMGKHSYEKHIPDEYKYSSFENRLELLRGLMDSDGSAEKAGCEYTTTSKQLADDVCELVHSLGGYCSITEKTDCGYKGKDGKFVKCRNAYRLVIQFSSNQPSPFWLERKRIKYQPKRDKLLRFITNIEEIGDHECTCIMIDDPCHLYITDDYIITHNTTLEKFFHSAVVGWFPMDFSLFYSHSGDITRMYYDGMVDIISNSDEYTWNEIFPELHIEGQNAKLEQLNVGKYKPFPSVQCTSVGAKNAGKVRASRFLFVDDMIGSIEEALNKNTLEKLWNAYSVDARQRKVQSPYDGIFCKELHLATRWSTLDVIGRLQTNYEDSDRAEFIAIPDIDERTGKSNFEYAIGGYTAENFHDIEILMDDISYRCLYKQDPIEREGLLYQDDELRRYIDLPNREPDAIMGICDTKEKGIDYMFLPIFYNYDNDYYLVDCICDDNSDFGLQYKRLTDIIVRHNVQQVEFESNQGGSRIAFEIQKRLKERGCRCNITTKPTETNKETRIIVNSDWIKQNCLFLNKTEYSPKSDYGKMMSFMLGYSVTGKNKHDDVPDGLANFALFVNRKLHYRPTQYTPGLF